MGGKGGKHRDLRKESKNSPPTASEFLTPQKRLPSSNLKDIAESGQASGTNRIRSEKIKDLIAHAFAVMHTNESIDAARVIVVFKQVCHLAKTAEVSDGLPKSGRVYFLTFKNLFSEIPCSDRVLEEALQRVDFEKWAKAAPTDEVAPLPLQPAQPPPKTAPKPMSKTRAHLPPETGSSEEIRPSSFSSVSSILYSENESKHRGDGEVITEDDFLTSAPPPLPTPQETPKSVFPTPVLESLAVPKAQGGGPFSSPLSPSPPRSESPILDRAPTMNRQPSALAKATALWSTE